MNQVFIIAEAGVNHNGDLHLARQLIDAAQAARADAVKFQLFHTEDLVTITAPKAAYQTADLSDPSSQYDMLKRLELSHQDCLALKKYCDQREIRFLATPFDTRSVDFLEPLVDRYKVASGDCSNLPLLHHIAQKQKPVILSTGMCTLNEVRSAVEVLEGCPITLLHCTTSYPCPPEAVNLRAMTTLAREFGLPIGYSDHTEGIAVSIAATALGATVIEKHLTLDRNLPGPDHKASLEPTELKRMIQEIRRTEVALGNGVKSPQPSELEIQKQARRSLVFARNLKAGYILQEQDIATKRPGTGIPPSEIEKVIGKKLRTAVSRDTLLTFDLLED